MTASFIKSIQQTLKAMEECGDTNSPIYKVYSDWANGWCGLCNKKLEVIEFRETGSGAEHILKCGHRLTAISLNNEVNKLKEGGGFSCVGVEQSGKLDIQVERSGFDMNKEAQEISVTKLFCHHFYPEFDTFRNDDQYSPYDVVAEVKSNRNKEYFQVTKLNDQDFWKKLNSDKRVDVVLHNIEKLVKDAIKRKINFDAKEKKKIILLIDANPGVINSVGEELKDKLSNLLKSAGFKQIWLSGRTKEITYRLH